MQAKTLQDTADELAIAATADQDRKTLALVEMQKVQHPPVPEGEHDGRTPTPDTPLNMLLHVHRPQGDIEQTQPPRDQVHSARHQPTALPGLIPGRHHSVTGIVVYVPAGRRNCPTHAA